MAPKITILGNNVLKLDWDLRDPDGIINAKAQNRQQWEDGVNNTLMLLLPHECGSHRRNRYRGHD
jgi:hypothetical protein